MAKGVIQKGRRGPSIHSRAARRATSPSINTDRSLKNAQLPQESVDRRPTVLATHHASGITKKAKSGRKAMLSSKARRRQEKNMDRAEAIMDRTAVKVQKSKGHARVIHSRKKTWDEINKDAFDHEEPVKISKKAQAKMDEDAMVEAFYADDGDEEMAGAEEVGEVVSVLEAAPIAGPVSATEQEEEIL